MERRARGAEDTAQELGARIDALEARIAEVSAERDRLSAELELQKATVDLAELAREQAEARLAEVLGEAPGPESVDEGADIAAVRHLPGLEEAARALREQEVAQPAEPAEPMPGGVDPFAEALAKLRGDREDLVAAVVPKPPAGDRVDEPAPLPEQVIPYVISAEHPGRRGSRGPSRRSTSATARAAARLVTQLLPDQARTVRRDLVYDLDLDGLGALRVELSADGGGRVLMRDGSSPDAEFSSRRPRSSSRPSRAEARRCARRAARGRRPAVLPSADAARTRAPPAPRARRARLRRRGRLDPAWSSAPSRARSRAVDPRPHVRGDGQREPGRETCRVVVQNGTPLRVVRVDEHGRRSAVVAATAHARPVVAEGAVGGADAVLTLTSRGALPLLAQAEPPGDEEPATALGDLAAATTLSSWFDRVQGLAPRG